LHDPFGEHRLRPLTEHLADWRQSLSRRAGENHVNHFTSYSTRSSSHASFRTMQDLDALRIEAFLERTQEGPPHRDRPDEGNLHEEGLAKLLGVTRGALNPVMRRHRLTASGNGKARRYQRRQPSAFANCGAAARA